MGENFGFGMLGEQGAESIHRRFNELSTTYRNKEKRLLCVVKEHLISISPDSISAQPPPTTRAKHATAV